MKKIYIISAAGGNNTAIAITEPMLSREKYEKIGSKILQETERKGVEQVGFLVPSIKHFEMSGGEFCGNAARSVAFLLSQITGKNKFDFTISGFDGKVQAEVSHDQNDLSTAIVSCLFKGMKTKIEEKNIDSKKVSIVDLGGIVHCILHETFPKDSYKEEHSNIITKLGLKDRLAVGVIWLNETKKGLKIDPVVWVKSINTFFHETSCGSGSIAVAVATGATEILQPSGHLINVKVDEKGVQLTSVIKEEFSYDDFSYITLDGKSKKTKSFFNRFSSLYIKAFSEKPYFESYDEEWVHKNVWEFHLKEGVIILALEDKNIVGLGCSLPLIKNVPALEFISNLPGKLFDDFKKVIYMSEIAVDSRYRNLGIGTELVKRRLRWAKTKGYKYFVMRTASVCSNSLNLYKRIGAKEIIEKKQNVKNSPLEVQSASEERVYLYGDL